MKVHFTPDIYVDLGKKLTKLLFLLSGLMLTFYFKKIIEVAIIKYAYLPKPVVKEQYLVNEAIRFPKVMVILDDGTNLGVLDIKKAQAEADKRQLDLVCIAAQANPPVCKILNYSKFKYEKQKKEKVAMKNQKNMEVKEIQLSPVIMEHDFNTKLSQAIKFLEQGNKVKVTIRLFRRYASLKDQAMDIVNDFGSKCASSGSTEGKSAMMEGNTIQLLISPVKKKAAKKEVKEQENNEEKGE